RDDLVTGVQTCALPISSSLVGRLGMGWLADRFPKKYVMLLIYVLVASAIPLLFLVGTPGAIYLFAVVFGIGLGGEYMLIPLMAEIGRAACRERGELWRF